MAQIRKVPENYTTPQAAHDAADAGDMILVAPNTSVTDYQHLVITKDVFLKGDTLTPEVDGPLLACRYWGDTSAHIIFELLNGRNLVIEGFRIGASGRYTGPKYEAGTGTGIIINRCVLAAPQYQSWLYGGGGVANIEARNVTCVPHLGQGSSWFANYAAGAAGSIIASVLVTAPNSYSMDRLIGADYVTSATEGYGTTYGSWLSDIWDGTPPYRVAGTILGTSVDKDSVQVFLFKATTNGMLSQAYKTTTPDAVTGEWEFTYVPPDFSYYVVLIPPEGHRGEVVGPYTPVQS